MKNALLLLLVSTLLTSCSGGGSSSPGTVTSDPAAAYVVLSEYNSDDATDMTNFGIYNGLQSLGSQVFYLNFDNGLLFNKTSAVLIGSPAVMANLAIWSFRSEEYIAGALPTGGFFVLEVASQSYTEVAIPGKTYDTTNVLSVDSVAKLGSDFAFMVTMTNSDIEIAVQDTGFVTPVSPSLNKQILGGADRILWAEPSDIMAMDGTLVPASVGSFSVAGALLGDSEDFVAAADPLVGTDYELHSFSFNGGAVLTGTPSGGVLTNNSFQELTRQIVQYEKTDSTFGLMDSTGEFLVVDNEITSIATVANKVGYSVHRADTTIGTVGYVSIFHTNKVSGVVKVANIVMAESWEVHYIIGADGDYIVNLMTTGIDVYKLSSDYSTSTLVSSHPGTDIPDNYNGISVSGNSLLIAIEDRLAQIKIGTNGALTVTNDSFEMDDVDTGSVSTFNTNGTSAIVQWADSMGGLHIRTIQAQ